ncbi:PRD domain-containing protein [Butyrivibrio sp. MC2013]|uniref:PRD domain-containing protein n=1 Tax=Butyrivibrio sp. MC2013 TaxID=1280686 RepID=UPI0004246B5C|nr:PRD domain-containing protein [Butyrivibrio sp. MC2013]
MYKIIKVLNNNALFVNKEGRRECILLGKGIGFGHKSGDMIDKTPAMNEYHLAKDDDRRNKIGTDSGIEPVYLEVAGRIIDEAKLVIDGVHSDILLPLADHIAFAAHREKQKIFVPNPFIPDIKVLYGKEYSVAIKCRNMIKEMAGYEVTEDEAGFIALHIHSGLSHEAVSRTMRDTQAINSAMKLIESQLESPCDHENVWYTRLMSHLYYIIVRTRNGDPFRIDLGGFMDMRYPTSSHIAYNVLRHIQEQLDMDIDPLEQGYLALHIESLARSARNTVPVDIR